MIYSATREDLPTVVELALKIPEEFSFENFPSVDKAKVTEIIFSNWTDAPIFLYKIENEIVGMVGLALDTLWWSNEPVLQDYMFYIKPEHRSLKVVNALIGAMRDVAKLNDMKVITTFIASDRTDSKRKLFERKGFKESGILMTYGV